MKHNAIDAIAEQVRNVLVQSEALQNAAHHIVVGFDRGRKRRRDVCADEAWLAPDLRLVQQFDQRCRTCHVDRYGIDHRQFQRNGQRSRVDMYAALRSQIGHVQRDDAGQAEAFHRQHQPQIAPQIGGVDHADHQIGTLFSCGMTA